jgi:hypothetical protein
LRAEYQTAPRGRRTEYWADPVEPSQISALLGALTIEYLGVLREELLRGTFTGATDATVAFVDAVLAFIPTYRAACARSAELRESLVGPPNGAFYQLQKQIPQETMEPYADLIIPYAIVRTQVDAPDALATIATAALEPARGARFQQHQAELQHAWSQLRRHPEVQRLVEPYRAASLRVSAAWERLLASLQEPN